VEVARVYSDAPTLDVEIPESQAVYGTHGRHGRQSPTVHTPTGGRFSASETPRYHLCSARAHGRSCLSTPAMRPGRISPPIGWRSSKRRRATDRGPLWELV